MLWGTMREKYVKETKNGRRKGKEERKGRKIIGKARPCDG